METPPKRKVADTWKLAAGTSPNSRPCVILELAKDSGKTLGVFYMTPEHAEQLDRGLREGRESALAEAEGLTETGRSEPPPHRRAS